MVENEHTYEEKYRPYSGPEKLEDRNNKNLEHALNLLEQIEMLDDPTSFTYDEVDEIINESLRRYTTHDSTLKERAKLFRMKDLMLLVELEHLGRRGKIFWLNCE